MYGVSVKTHGKGSASSRGEYFVAASTTPSRSGICTPHSNATRAGSVGFGAGSCAAAGAEAAIRQSRTDTTRMLASWTGEESLLPEGEGMHGWRLAESCGRQGRDVERRRASLDDLRDELPGDRRKAHTEHAVPGRDDDVPVARRRTDDRQVVPGH